MSAFILQMIALIALIYNVTMVVGLIVWLIKGFITDWRQYHDEETVEP